MVMHRRRSRRSGRLGSTPEWLMNIIPGSVRADGPVAVSAAPSTKKALKGKADSKAKLERQLARGSECCPVIRVKCEAREITVQKKSKGYVKSYDYAKEKYVRSAVDRETPVKRKVRLCSVSAGKHQGDLLPPKEAKQEKKMLAALLRAENCAVRTAGDKLGGK